MFQYGFWYIMSNPVHLNLTSFLLKVCKPGARNIVQNVKGNVVTITCWNVSICHMYCSKYIGNNATCLSVCILWAFIVLMHVTQKHKFILLNHGKLWISEIMTTCIDTKVTCYMVDITSLLMFHKQWETSIYDSMKLLRFGSHSYVSYRKSMYCRFSLLISSAFIIVEPTQCNTETVHEEN